MAAVLPAAIAASAGPPVVATISLGGNEEATAFALAVNPRTNKTYETPGLEPLGCESHIVSVIDNATNTTLAPITTGLIPFGVAVNPKTNKIYVANIGGGRCSEETSKTISRASLPIENVASTVSVEPSIAVISSTPAWVTLDEVRAWIDRHDERIEVDVDVIENGVGRAVDDSDRMATRAAAAVDRHVNPVRLRIDRHPRRADAVDRDRSCDEVARAVDHRKAGHSAPVFGLCEQPSTGRDVCVAR